MSTGNVSRRDALGLASALLAGCAITREEPPATGAPVRGAATDPVRLPPGDELANSLEFEEQARLVLPPDIFDGVAGGDREGFFRLTFRPRINVPTLDMDLTVRLFGESLFTPLLVAPISDQGAYHPRGELATVQGAAAADTMVIVSSRSTLPIGEIAEQTTGPLWYSVYADDEGRRRAVEGVEAGAKVLFLTSAAAYRPPGARRTLADRAKPIDWRALDEIRRGLEVPVVLKGVTDPGDAAMAVERGFQGIVVSSHGGDGSSGRDPSIDALPSIVDVVAGRFPVLADGSFRRGTDVLKALILGADAVLVGRPVAWALAAYGADGVQSVLEMMQEELARSFGMLGVSRPAALTPMHIRRHSVATA